MIIAVILMIAAGVIGWRRAAQRGGKTVDKLQYAAAHAIPAFLIGMIGMVVAGEMGWLGYE